MESVSGCVSTFHLFLQKTKYKYTPGMVNTRRFFWNKKKKKNTKMFHTNEQLWELWSHTEKIKIQIFFSLQGILSASSDLCSIRFSIYKSANKSCFKNPKMKRHPHWESITMWVETVVFEVTLCRVRLWRVHSVVTGLGG